MALMLVALRDGYLDDDGLVEVIAGRTRIAPEILRERPQYTDFFEADVHAAGPCAESRATTRTVGPIRISRN